MIEHFYNTIKNFIDDEYIKIILDLGSRDLAQSVEFSKIYKNAKIYAFECNPQLYQSCISRSKEFPNIKVINKAVHKIDGRCDFYITDTRKSKNVGTSSIFRSSGKYDYIERIPQIKINVECVRLNNWTNENGINKVDIIWMDIQGAELFALEGMGDYSNR